MGEVKTTPDTVCIGSTRYKATIKRDANSYAISLLLEPVSAEGWCTPKREAMSFKLPEIKPGEPILLDNVAVIDIPVIVRKL